MDETESVQYLKALLNRKLRVHTTDARMFIGDFKCTDHDSNLILAHSHEYRRPSASAVKAAADASTSSEATVLASMTCRYLGLIVVPGKHITKIEVEENEDGAT